MSKDIAVNIYLPLPKLDKNKVYTVDDLAEYSQLYCNYKDVYDDYFKTLKIKSMYASRSDIEAYLMKTYKLKKSDFEGCVISYKGYSDEYEYILGDVSYKITKDIENMLKKEHIDEYVYSNPYSHFSTNYYGNMNSGMYEVNDEIIGELLQDRLDSCIGHCEDKAESLKNLFEEDYVDDSSQIVVKAMIGKVLADKVNGKCFIEIY